MNDHTKIIGDTDFKPMHFLSLLQHVEAFKIQYSYKHALESFGSSTGISYSCKWYLL